MKRGLFSIIFVLICSVALAAPFSQSPAPKYQEKDGDPSLRSRTVILPNDTISQDSDVSDRVEILLVSPTSADQSYLRLDCTNDPLTGDELDAGSANFTTTGSGAIGSIINANRKLSVPMKFSAVPAL